MRPALPNFDVVVADPLTIHVESGGKTVFQLNFDRIAQYCTQQPDRCDEALADYAAKASRMVADQNAPLAPESLRAVVRPAAYVDALKQQLGGSVEFVAAPLAGDLEVLCYADLPTAMRPVFAADIARLKLDAAAALALCRKNVAAVLPPLKVALEPDAIGTLRGDAYESSYLALHDAWAPLAHSLAHPLLVARAGRRCRLLHRREGRGGAGRAADPGGPGACDGAAPDLGARLPLDRDGLGGRRRLMLQGALVAARPLATPRSQMTTLYNRHPPAATGSASRRSPTASSPLR